MKWLALPAALVATPAHADAFTKREIAFQVLNAAAAATPTDTLNGDALDAHGWPWSADLHASTQTITKEGLWRMKVGVKRPDPKPGFPIVAQPLDL